jgi:cytoskeleton protein RodZ
MSDQADGDGVELNSPPSESVPATGPGSLLRQAREEAGIHIAALASALKVPVARIEALEAERFDLMPDVAFVRALAASVCRVLKLDPAPILALLPQPARPLLAQRASTPGPSFRADGRGFGRPAGGLSRPLIGVVVLLVIGAGTLLLLPRDRLSEWTGGLSGSPGRSSPQLTAATTASGQDGSPSSNVVNKVSPAESSQESGKLAGTSESSNKTTGQGATLGSRVSDGGSAAVQVPQSSASPALSAKPQNGGGLADSSVKAVATTAGTGVLAQTASAASASGTVGGIATPGSASAQGGAADAQSQAILMLRATQPSWVKVADAKGTVLLQKNLEAGVPEAISGNLPLSVIIGRADVTDVSVRGKKFPLGPVTRNNVARFEVK